MNILSMCFSGCEKRYLLEMQSDTKCRNQRDHYLTCAALLPARLEKLRLCSGQGMHKSHKNRRSSVIMNRPPGLLSRSWMGWSATEPGKGTLILNMEYLCHNACCSIPHNPSLHYLLYLIWCEYYIF